ncbi:MAG: DUF1489 domain-containing protein [Alphaproteobacteria bacterium]|jgi:hypothetical protein|nr:DUF1489 domain-containing protein [Alphaproteobacteria bacterium]MDP6563816.1 DUF1489 domain-containing protein [Alphaproteobacteria bacterium]MDP6811747.1 DUF1489 domain-containing protein [Alphaproteobacteria bacterium]
MTVHLLKLCVGTDSIDHLVEWQAARRAARAANGEPAESVHRTRHRPRRGAEVLDGGSIYWIIKGFIRVRQRIIRLDEISDDEFGKRCGLVLDPKLVRTALQARRPHQGWRYLETKDAPMDLPDGEWAADDGGPPPEMAAALRELGLI